MFEPSEARYDEATESLLRDLAAVLRQADPVPRSELDAPAALRPLDDELAQLGRPGDDPTERAEPADGAVRGEQEVRLVSFEIGGVGLELEVVRRGRTVRVVGQVAAPAARSALVEHAAGSTELRLDESGRFLLDGLPAGSLRVRCLTVDGATAATTSITI